MIPPGVILMWGSTNASIPSGWQRETSLDSKYPKSLTSADPGSTGGANTHTHSDGGHTHTMSSHNHSYSLAKCDWEDGANTTTDPAYKFLTGEHAHPSTSTSSTSGGSLQSTTVTWSSVNHEPSYRTVIFIKPDTGTMGSLASGIIALLNDSSVPSNWYYCNGSNSTIDLRNRFIKGAAGGANANSAGGGTSHQHSVTHGHSSNSHTHTGTSEENDTDWGGDTRQGWDASPNDHSQHPHTHEVTLGNTTANVDNYSKSDAGSGDTVLPEYKCIGAIQATSDGAIVEKMVGLWMGTRASIPTGWDLCLTGDSKILLSNGKKKKIKEIVEKQKNVEVVSYNTELQKFEAKRVVNWMKNPAKKGEWYKIVIDKGKGSGSRTLEVTKDHPVLTKRGYVKAKNLRDSDRIYRFEETLTSLGEQALLGMYLGDGCLENTKRFTIRHSTKQNDYIKHLSDKLNSKIYYGIANSGYGKGKGYGVVRKSLKTFSPKTAKLMQKPKINKDILSRLGRVGLAYWYMDDGSLAKDKRNPDYYRVRLHTDGFSKAEIKIIRAFFAEQGIKTKAYFNSLKTGKVINFERDTQDKFLKLIVPYIIPSMQYKLPLEFRGKIKDFDFIKMGTVGFNFISRKLVTYSPSKRNLAKYNYKYDIEVEDNHSFIANGFIVHNCDGGDNTMDLRGKFIRIGGSLSNNGDTGGSNTHNHSNISHSHSASSSHNHSGTHGNASTCWHSSSGSAGKTPCDHTHTVSSISSVTASYSSTNITADTKSNQPAYKTAAYIQYNGYPVLGGMI